jgi:outer membrane protein TolC
MHCSRVPTVAVVRLVCAATEALAVLVASPAVRAQASAPPAAVRAPPPASTPATTSPSAAESPAPPAIGLADAVHQALSRNQNAVVAYEEVRRAAAIVEQARASSLPTLTALGEYTRLDGDRRLSSSTTGAPGQVIAAVDQLSANLTLTVPILATRPWAQWSHASDNVDIAKASSVDVRRAVAVAVARAYLAIVAQKRVIDAAERARDTDRAHYEFAHQRHVGGIGNRIDEVRADQQGEGDEASLQQQYANLAKDREVLGVLVGVGGALDAQEPNLQADVDPGRALTEAERRSDVVVADTRLKAAEHTVRDDWTDYAPYLTGVVQPFYQNPPTLTLPLTGWQAQLVLTIPLYDGGLRYGQARERGALRDEARAELDGALRQARSDVRVAFDELKRADLALAAADRAAELAHEGLDLAQLAYRAGASTDIEVIDAERTARDADTAVAVAEDGARQARLDLLAATGRFP